MEQLLPRTAPRRRPGLVARIRAALALRRQRRAAQGSGPTYQPVREIQASRESHPPRYPIEAIRDGVGGTVTVLADINERGHVVGARIEHSDPEGVFDAASLQAVVQWRFEPATRNGVAIREQVRVPITFSVTREADDVAD